MEKIPTVKIEFWNLPDLIMEEEQYKQEGKFKGLLKSFHLSISDVKKVHHLLMRPQDYPTNAWEG
jgi:hypothetical protein